MASSGAPIRFNTMARIKASTLTNLSFDPAQGDCQMRVQKLRIAEAVFFG